MLRRYPVDGLCNDTTHDLPARGAVMRTAAIDVTDDEKERVNVRRLQSGWFVRPTRRKHEKSVGRRRLALPLPPSSHYPTRPAAHG